MSEVEKKEKQNINNIKALYALYKDKKMHSLFHEVKKVKFDAYNLAKKFKDEIRAAKRLEEEKAKVETLQMGQVKEEKDKESFAELFAMSNKKETTNNVEEELKPEEQKKEEKVETVKEEKVQEKPVEKKEKPQTFKPQANKPQTSSSTQYVPGRPYVPKYQNEQNKGYKRPLYNQTSKFQNNSFNKKPGDRPPYKSANTPYKPNQSRFGKPQGDNQNKGLLSIIPKKSSGLESASSAFGEKERNFGNKKKSYDRQSDDDKRINKKSLLRRGLIEEKNIEERMVTRKLKIKKPKQETAQFVHSPITNAVITTPNLTVKILSEKIGKPVTEIMKQLMILLSLEFR